MSKPRTVIDQKLCRKAEMMFKDPKATVKEVAALLGVSPATMSRICTAGFSVEQYEKNNAERNQKEKGKLERFQPMEKLPLAQQPIQTVLAQQPIQTDNLEECPGQISMDLQPAEEQEEEVVTYLAAIYNQHTQIIDYLAQILRRMDK